MAAWRKFGMENDGIEFFKQLLTESEVVMLGRRMQIARLLLRGFSFPKIARELKVGTSTIRGVHRWLRKRWPEYRLLLASLPTKYTEMPPYEGVFLGELRRKYPGKMVLLDLLLGDPLERKGT